MTGLLPGLAVIVKLTVPPVVVEPPPVIARLASAAALVVAVANIGIAAIVAAARIRVMAERGCFIVFII